MENSDNYYFYEQCSPVHCTHVMYMCSNELQHVQLSTSAPTQVPQQVLLTPPPVTPYFTPLVPKYRECCAFIATVTDFHGQQP